MGHAKTGSATVSPEGRAPGLSVLQKRSDFLRLARGAFVRTPSFFLQACKHPQDPKLAGELGIRVGFTCSKKVGNAVARNRAKRRLRALSREVFPKFGLADWDYVLIGRADVTAAHPFAQMQKDLIAALRKAHKA